MERTSDGDVGAKRRGDGSVVVMSNGRNRELNWFTCLPFNY